MEGDDSNYAILNSYDMMIFPTYYAGEGVAGVIVDAFIAGLPVIASDLGSCREVISDKETGYLVNSIKMQNHYSFF